MAFKPVLSLEPRNAIEVLLIEHVVSDVLSSAVTQCWCISLLDKVIFVTASYKILVSSNLCREGKFLFGVRSVDAQNKQSSRLESIAVSVLDYVAL